MVWVKPTKIVQEGGVRTNRRLSVYLVFVRTICMSLAVGCRFEAYRCQHHFDIYSLHWTEVIESCTLL